MLKFLLNFLRKVQVLFIRIRKLKKNIWKKKKILITGAKGFVGKNLIKELNLKKKNYSFKLFTPTRNILDLNNINKLNKYFLKKKTRYSYSLSWLKWWYTVKY